MALIPWGKHHRKISWLVKPSSFDDANKPEEVTIVYELREPAAPGKFYGHILYSSMYQDLAQAEAIRLHNAGTPFDLSTKWMLHDGKYVGKKAYLEAGAAGWKPATKVKGYKHPPPRPLMIALDEHIKLLQEAAVKPDGPSHMVPAMSMNENMAYVAAGSHEVMAFHDLGRKEHRATYIGTSPVFKGRSALVRQGDKYPTIVFAQFDYLIEHEGVQYGTGWHPFAADAFEVQ